MASLLRNPEYFACNNRLLYFVRGPELPGLSVPGRIGRSCFKLETDTRHYREALAKRELDILRHRTHVCFSLERVSVTRSYTCVQVETWKAHAP